MKSLQGKLLFVILPVLILALLFVTYVNNSQAQKFLEGEFNEKAEVSLEKAQIEINEYFVQRLKEIEVLANTSTIQSMNVEQIVPYLASELARMGSYEMLLVSDLDGMATSHAGTEADVRDRDYFVAATQSGETVLSQPIISRATEELVVAIGAPIRNEQGLAGVVIATVPISDIVSLVSNLQIGQNGYAFLVNESGIVIAHPNQELIMETNFLESSDSTFRSIIERSINNETGSLVFNDNGVESYGYYTVIPETNWGLVISAPVAEVTSNISYLAKLSFITAAVVLVLSAIIIILFARRIVIPIKQLSELTSRVAEGDLTISVDHRSRDEVGVLSNNFNTMVLKMQEMLKNIDTVSNTVKSSSDTLLVSSQETKQASEQVAVTISELASGMTDISHSVTTTTDQMNHMVTTVNEISSFTDEVIATSSQSKAATERGKLSANQAVERMVEVNRSVEEAATIIRKLDQQSKEIGNIIGMITNIADQTNLLALNASIEAARAGEHGRGFAVVADEVRKLASETSDSAERIARLIHETQNESNRAVSAIESGFKVVDEGTGTVRDAGKAFEEIDRFVDNVLNKNKEIDQSIKQLHSIAKDIGTNMESVSAVIEEATAGTEEVSASSEEQSASANQISYDAESLAELANELQKIMTQFRTK
ncbi:methyl-accepting chemotaxis protein [Anaerobacillus sp. MEB173]|uniref:methyl-accepting chemotaxis protein n=1 Tax=Anaerobacillus sp. MEB173 TaxID=3383345 RepID=UPI003F8E82D4